MATMYKNNCSILGLTKGRCKFTTSDFPAENRSVHNETPFSDVVTEHLIHYS